ncbi:MAG: retropepsin-like aspartic protease [Patescibacteria group bacterium]
MARLRKPNGKARYFELLIDTGADYTLISQYDAQLLGLKYKAIKQKEIKVEVANLTFIYTKKVSLLLTIEGHEFTIPVLIARDGVESLLGRKGLFEHFEVVFQEYNQQVIFKKKAIQ